MNRRELLKATATGVIVLAVSKLALAKTRNYAKKGDYWVRDCNDGKSLFYKETRLMVEKPDITDKYKPFIEKAHGKVFMGGLGTGYIIPFLLKNEKVTSITCVEIVQEIIDLCAIKNDKVTYVCGDAYAVDKAKYDCWIMDLGLTIDEMKYEIKK